MAEVKVGEIKEINLAPKTEAEDVQQCLSMILNTVQGTVPFMRDFGISGVYMHGSIVGNENDIAEEIADQIEDYEKRVETEDVMFEATEHDTLEYTVPYTLLSEEEDEDNE